MNVRQQPMPKPKRIRNNFLPYLFAEKNEVDISCTRRCWGRCHSHPKNGLDGLRRPPSRQSHLMPEKHVPYALRDERTGIRFSHSWFCQTRYSSVSFHLCVGKSSPHKDRLHDFDRVIREMHEDENHRPHRGILLPGLRLYG